MHALPGRREQCLLLSSRLSIKYLLNTFVPSMFYVSIKLGTAPKEEVFADRLISKRLLFTQWIQMAQRGCKHLLRTQKCLVITNPPSSSLQKSYKTGAFNFQPPNLLPGSFLFCFRKGIAVAHVCALAAGFGFWQVGL